LESTCNQSAETFSFRRCARLVILRLSHASAIRLG
jgi:hypothetical protein